VALGSAALFTLPFYIMARKRVVQSGAVAVPQKKVRIGVIAAVIVFGSVAALVALVAASYFGI
jgi:hypothetical protein